MNFNTNPKFRKDHLVTDFITIKSTVRLGHALGQIISMRLA